MALLNNDTLYFYKCNSASLNKAPGNPVEFNNLKFKIGKYYYMYKRGRLNWGQKEYFENNMDSLTRIRGNDLPELPDLRLSKKACKSYDLQAFGSLWIPFMLTQAG
jgi:hypothetical protein